MFFFLNLMLNLFVAAFDFLTKREKHVIKLDFNICIHF